MGGRGGRSPRRRVDRSSPPSALEVPPALPVTPVDLLAGIAPGVELYADDTDDDPATVSVDEVGKMIRSGDSTVRRLIRKGVIEPMPEGVAARDDEPERAGILPRTPEKPGE